jgi:predicted RNA-binding protein with PUA-like domain
VALNSGSGGGGSGAIRAGRAFVEVFTKNSLGAGLNAAAADLKAFGSKISSIGLKFAGLGAAGVAGLLPISNTLNDIAKQGKIADAIGLTAEQFTGIAGVARVSQESHPDPSQFERHSPYHDAKSKKEEPTWMMVELEFVEKFPRVLPLERLKAEKALENMPLVKKGTRLSVMPVTEKEWSCIQGLAKKS